MKKDQAFYAPCFRPAFFQITVMAHSFEAGQNFGQSESERKQGESKVHRKLDLSSFDDELEEDLESTAPAPKAEGSSVEYLA